jgi:hypothetical protein
MAVGFAVNLIWINEQGNDQNQHIPPRHEKCGEIPWKSGNRHVVGAKAANCLSAGRIGRNPRSGVKVEVRDKSVPVFRPSKEMGRRLNPVASIPVSSEWTSRRSG